jgi:hypothetical protein
MLSNVSRRDADLKSLCSIPLTEYYTNLPSTLITRFAALLRQRLCPLDQVRES